MWTLIVLVLMMLLGLANSQELVYAVNFNSPIYVCPDESSQPFVDTSHVNVARYNRTNSVMTGYIKFLKGFEQDTMIEFIIEEDIMGEYSTLTTYEICDFCAELANPDSKHKNYIQGLSLPPHCPVEANSYPIRDLVAETKYLPFLEGFEGSYQVTVKFFKRTDDKCLGEKTFLACFKLDVIVERF